MRYLYVLLAAMIPTLSSDYVSAQINFGSFHVDAIFEPSSGYQMLGGSPFEFVEPTSEGFRFRGDFNLARNTNITPGPPFGNSILNEPVLRFFAFRDFVVGPLPVQVDFSLSEDVKWILANGQDANPRFEIASRAYVMSTAFGEPSLIEPLFLESVAPDESSMAGIGIYPSDLTLSVEDYILGPTNGRPYLMVYETSVFVRHDTIPNDPAAILTFQGGAFSAHTGIDLNLHSSVIAPEPGSLGMAAVGVVPLVWFGWGRKRHAAARQTRSVR